MSTSGRRRTIRDRRVRCPRGRRRRPYVVQATGIDVLGVLTATAVRLQRAPAHRPDGRTPRSFTPCWTRWYLPAAVGVRGVVPVPARRRARAPDRRRRPAPMPPRRPPARRSRRAETPDTVVHLLRHGGPQPRRRALRTTRRISVPSDPRAPDGRFGPTSRTTATSRTGGRRRWSGRRRPRDRSRRCAAPDHHRRPRSRSPINDVRRGASPAGRTRCATRGTWRASGTVQASWAGALQHVLSRMMAAVHDAREAATGHEAVIAVASCRSGSPACAGGPSFLHRPAPPAVHALARPSRFVGDRSRRSAT